MRIISGKHKGRILNTFEGTDIRPTSDRAREALFNILQNKVVGSNFVDVFCGTGACGIEAISRYCNSCTFVDSSKKSLDLTSKNLSLIKEQAKLVLSDALNFFIKTDEKYDIIFLDAPYKYDKMEDILKVIKERNILNENGIIVYEHSDSYKFCTKTFEIYDTRKYGIAVFEFLKEKV